MKTSTELALVGAGAFDPDEQRLMDASIRGDVDAFARVYARYRSALYEACYAILRSPSLAEDVVHDTFVRAFTGLTKFDVSKRLWPWLVTIARRRCLDLLRRGARTSLVGDIQAELPASLCDQSQDTTIDAVLGAEERARLRKALATLPARQRRVLLLHALEGWNYSDIASAEHSSVGSVKSLIFRARMNLKTVYQTGMLGLGLIPFRRIRARLHLVASRTTSRGELAAAGIMPGATNLAAGALAFAMVIVGAAPGGPVQAGSAFAAVRSPEIPVAPSAARAPRTAHAADARTNHARELDVTHAKEILDEQVVEPGKNATPESTQFTAFAVSPGYARDHTIFASGTVACLRPPCYVLFVSRNGGESWGHLPAASFHGGSILLPPNYPADDTIFAMGAAGLQISIDGGKSFEIASPVIGGVAISPEWAHEDKRILIGTTPAVIEYWPERKLVKPAPLTVLARQNTSLEFSPSYASDGLILAGSMIPSASDTRTSAIYRCVWSACSTISLDSTGVPALRLSPNFVRDRTLYAFTEDRLYKSTDSGATFEPIALPSTDGAISDVRVTSSGPLMAVQDFQAADAATLYLLSAKGWISLSLPSRQFAEGARQLLITPNGHWIVASTVSGMACSSNSGRTWSGRCATNS